MLFSAAHREGFGCATVEADCAVHVRMEGRDHLELSWGASNLPQEAEESASTDQVKGFCQVNEYNLQGLLLLSALLLQLMTY